MNRHGNRANLLPGATPGNTNAVRHGVFSRSGRVLGPRARELADAILEAPHTSHLDELGAEEIGALIALLEQLDRELGEGGTIRRGNRDRLGLLKLRLQASRRLGEWLSAYGLTPRSRAEFARELAAGETLADALRRRREET